MRSGCLTLIIFLLVLYMIVDKEKPPEVQTQELITPNPSPDPNREVIGFDWKKMEYIYRDQVKPNPRTEPDPPPMPDYYVAPVPQRKLRRQYYGKEAQIIHKGKRYRVNTKPDGTIELIPIR